MTACQAARLRGLPEDEYRPCVEIQGRCPSRGRRTHPIAEHNRVTGPPSRLESCIRPRVSAHPSAVPSALDRRGETGNYALREIDSDVDRHAQSSSRVCGRSCAPVSRRRARRTWTNCSRPATSRIRTERHPGATFSRPSKGCALSTSTSTRWPTPSWERRLDRCDEGMWRTAGARQPSSHPSPFSSRWR